MGSALEMIDMGIRDTSGDGQVRQPDPSKWEKPRDDGKGKHAESWSTTTKTSRPVTTTEQLAAELTGKIPTAWAGAFNAVDRAAFIPARIWVYDDRNEPQPLDRDTDPQRWRQVVYSDTAIMTQFDNGATVWPDTTGDHPTSSASQPSLVLDMLASLDAQDRHRVLEIGTGTGYNAALLATRLGDRAVSTIEIDATVALQARTNLATSGYTPTVITGDGAAGYPAGAPYDRVIATASVRPGELPYAWVDQTRPGGIIVTPWGPDYHNGVTTRLWVYEVVGEFSGALTVGLLVPHCHKIVEEDPEDEYHHHVRIHDCATGSWATVDVYRGSTTHPVRQHGPRRLWDEVEQAHAWWVHHGRPAYTRFGITVTATEQWAWLDNPDQRIAITGLDGSSKD
jgi:protein-L-isoaspartate O-methyltransferase